MTSVYQQLPLFTLEWTCYRCGIAKPPDGFYRTTHNRRGLMYECKDCHKAAANARAAANRDYGREYYASHRDHMRENMRKNWWRHREEREAAKKAWMAAHPEWVRAYSKKRKALRRALIISAEGTHNAKDIQAIYASQQGLCAYCNKAVAKHYHLDHMTPLIRGGTNWPSNLCIACPSCNCRKRAMTAEEFRAKMLAMSGR